MSIVCDCNILLLVAGKDKRNGTVCKVGDPDEIIDLFTQEKLRVKAPKF